MNTSVARVRSLRIVFLVTMALATGGWNNNFGAIMNLNSGYVPPPTWAGDPCLNPHQLPSRGVQCYDGSLYAGDYNGKRYFVNNSGCGYTMVSTTCSGNTDSGQQSFGANGTSGATDVEDGFTNTPKIPETAGGNGAASKCDATPVHNKNDWFLPALNEFRNLLTNAPGHMGFASGYYWTSTESGSSNAYIVSTTNSATTTSKGSDYYYRCVRKINIPVP